MTASADAWCEHCGEEVTAFRFNSGKWRCPECNIEVEPYE